VYLSDVFLQHYNTIVSLRRIDHSSRGVLLTVVRLCVWSRNLENEGAKARYWAVKIQPQWVVKPGKQTNKQYNSLSNTPAPPNLHFACISV